MEFEHEAFKPPCFQKPETLLARIINFVRRFVDLQAGTLWQDLKDELSSVRGRAVDVGCGAQVYRSLFPDDVSYTGLDTTDARARFGYDEPDTLYVTGDVWPIPDASVDFVLCTEVLEHILKPQVFVLEINRILKEEGRLVMTVPFAARWHYIPYDYWRFTPSGLENILVEAGFYEIEIRARGNPLTVLCYKAMAIPILCVSSPGRGGFAQLVGVLSGIFLAPLFIVAAVVGNLSLWFDWGEDCLGYTISARKKLQNG